MTGWKDPRFFIAAFIMTLFAYAYWLNPTDEAMKGAIIASLSTAVGFWLGSSSGSKDKTAMMSSKPDGTPQDPIATEEV